MGFPCQTIVMLWSWVGADMSMVCEFRRCMTGFLILEGCGREWFWWGTRKYFGVEGLTGAWTVSLPISKDCISCTLGVKKCTARHLMTLQI
jgi:hypothetical protein